MKPKYSKGSEWRRWDLHVHTPASYDWHGGEVTPEELVEKAIEEGLSVIAVTDHHRVGWVDQIANAANDKGLTILPGVELRTDKGNRGIHVIGIFPEGTSAKNIYDKILSPLGFSDSDISTKGDDQIYCDFEEACKKIKEMNGIISLHAGKRSCGIEQLNSDARSLLKKDIANQVDILEVTDTAQVEDYEKKVFPNVGRKWPMIVTSDSVDRQQLSHKKGHSLDCIGKSFTWIKADPTFEGLKQIKYEPNLRIKIQEDDPNESETFARIENCSIGFPDDLRIRDKESGKSLDFCLRGAYEILFSNNLTCVIGGRGSGKSTVIHILYNLWENNEIGKLHEINSPISNLELSREPLTKVRELTSAEIPANTEFFLQNEIEKFARDIDEMSKLVRHRLDLLSSLDSASGSLKEKEKKWSDVEKEIAGLLRAYEYISDTDKEIDLLNHNIRTLRKQVDVIKSKEYKALQKEIEEASSCIARFNAYQNDYEKLIKEIVALSDRIKKLDWRHFKNQEILNQLFKGLDDQILQIKASVEASKEEFDEQKYPNELEEKKEKLKRFLHEKGLSEENIEELTDAAEQINSLEAKVRNLKTEKLPYEDIYKRREELLGDYQEKYKDYRKRFFEVANELEKRLSKLDFTDDKGRINFEPKTSYKILTNAITQFIKRSNKSKTTLSIDNIQTVLFDSRDISDLINDKQKIRDIVIASRKATIHTQVLQELVNDDVFLERLYLEMYKHYFDIGNILVQTELDGKLLQNTSFGERCGIVIAIILVAGTNPIVIDQLEDNLDGKFISKVLVPLVRRQKQNRQIILITRDANIVIGGDAELIQILESSNGKTTITPSTIENIRERSKYIWILDGGVEAFQKREEKYNIK